MATWQCVKNCGACCQLDPADRPDLADYLSPTDLSLYLSMVGEDGWCVNYDKTKRECRIYDERPTFCRVEKETFEKLFHIPPSDLNDFAIECCEQQITGIYGNRSEEMDRFYAAVGIESKVIELTAESVADLKIVAEQPTDTP